jgi:GntR family transcriptional regulator
VASGSTSLAASRAPETPAGSRDPFDRTGREPVVILAVDTASGVPAYEQIREQVSRMIASGVLPAGARLPTIQQLANDLHLAPGTVARGYKELEREGLVISRRRKGTVVADRPDRAPTREIREELDTAIERFVLQVRQLGGDPADALVRAQALLDSGRLAS